MTVENVKINRSFRYILIIMCLLIIVVIGGGILNYYKDNKTLKIEALRTLNNLTDLKIEQIVRWQNERLGDAKLIQSSKSISDAVNQFISQRNKEQQKVLLYIFDKYMQAYQYRDYRLIDNQGKVLLSGSKENNALGPYAQSISKDIIHKKTIFLSDIHVSPFNNKPHMDLWIPILYPSNEYDAPVVGAIILEIDPDQFLYPYLEKWTNPTNTSESFLVRQEGKEVVFISPLRNSKAKPLEMRIPLSRSELVAVRAIKGEKEISFGKDYRGKWVLSAAKPVPGSGWYLVAKVDLDEVLAPAKEKGLWILGTVIILVGFCLFTILLIWKQQQVHLENLALQNEMEKKRYQGRYELLAQNAYDTIVLANQDCWIIEANHQAEKLYGYTQDEIQSMKIEQLFAPECSSLLLEIREKLKTETGQIIVANHIKKNQQVFQAEISISQISIEDETYIQFIIRDISLRKKNEDELRYHVGRLELLASITTAMPGDEPLADKCEKIAGYVKDAFHLDACVIRTLDEHQDLHLLASSGLPESGKIPIMSGRLGLGKLILRDKKPIVINDVHSDSRLSNFTAMYKGGYEFISYAGAPMIVGDKVIGIIGVYSSNKLIRFTETDVKHLQIIANPVGALIANDILFKDLKNQALELEKQIQVRLESEQKAIHQLEHIHVLHEIDLLITSGANLEANLHSVLRRVQVQLRVDAVEILLLNPASFLLEYKSGIGFHLQDHFTAKLDLTEGFAGKIALEKQSKIILNIFEYSNVSSKFTEWVRKEGFRAYGGVPLISKGEIKGVMEVYSRTALPDDPDWLEFFENLGTQAAIAIDNAQLFEGLQKTNTELLRAYETTLEGWSRAMDLRDKDTEGHTQRVAQITVELATRLGIRGEEITQIKRGALLHDIGKIGVPDSILLKPGPLTDEEWGIMEMHPVYAYEMIYPIEYLRPAIDIPYCHHEKWNGTGYPRGLKGEEIPIAARIFTLVDVWDALTSDRPYRKGWPPEKVWNYIQELSGVQFDPRITRIFLNLMMDQSPKK